MQCVLWPSNAKYLYLIPAQIPNAGIMRNGHGASPTIVSVGTFAQSCCIILLSGKSSDILKSTLIFRSTGFILDSVLSI